MYQSKKFTSDFKGKTEWHSQTLKLEHWGNYQLLRYVLTLSESRSGITVVHRENGDVDEWSEPITDE